MIRIFKKILGMNFELTIARRKKENRDEVFISYLKAKIAGMENCTLLNKGKKYAYNSISNYKKILRVWPEFERFADTADLKFSQIGLDTYAGFMEYCDRCNYAESTKYQYVALIKSIMNSALEEGVSSTVVQNSRNFVTHRPSIIYKKVYLTRDEIGALAELDLRHSPQLMKVRDVFLAGCYCGQRFSDYSCISAEDIETVSIGGREYRTLRRIQKKTGKMVVIPILDDGLTEIIDRWGGSLPKVSISFLNTSIKTICMMAGIDSSVTVWSCRGGTRVRTVHHKYELVSSHTARRSYITNLYLDGRLSTEQIRSISGHTSEESFRRYLCQNLDEEAREIIRRYVSAS